MIHLDMLFNLKTIFAGKILSDQAEAERVTKTLHRLNRELKAISNCNQTLLRAVDEQTLLDNICRIICEQAGYRLAWVGYAEHDEAKTVRPVAWAGFDGGYIANANITWADDTEHGRGPTGIAIRSGTICYAQDFTTDPRLAPWRASALQRGYRSSIALPLQDEVKKTFGVLNIYSTEPNAFTPDEIRLMEELSGDLAFGIIALRTRTERQRVEKALRASEERFHSLFECAPLGYQSLDEEGRFIEVNQAWAEILGYTRAEVIGKWFGDFLAPEFVEAFRQRFPVFKAQGKIHSEFQMLHKKGGRRFIAFEGRIAYKPDGSFKQTHCILQDITERQRVEEALHKSEKDLKEAQRLAKIGSWDWDASTDTITWSAEYYRIFGFDPARRPPGYADHLKIYTPESAARLDAAVKRNMQTGEAYDIDLELARTEGSCRWITARSETKRDAQGKIIGLLGTAQDITERKLAEAALRQAKEQAEAANRYKTDFLMNISHDLRTPLNAILGFAYILKSVDMAEKYRKSVDLINERAKYLQVLVEDILDVSRMESGRTELKSEEFDFHKMLENSIAAARDGVGQKDLTLSLAVKGTIPRLKGDALRVQQVVDNLLSNAVKYTERGEIQVTVECDEAPPDKDTYRARVSVKDTGIGIPAEKLPYVFDPFTRFHEFYKGKAFDGVGLGLHIVQELVRLMGGSVSVSSEVNKGSEFRFTLNFTKINGAV